MNRNKTFTFFILIVATLFNIVQAKEIKNENTLIIPMPDGLNMAFIPVCVSSDEGFFNWKKIKLGDPAGGFKEYPTVMALGGSFPLEQNGKRMWCYYMGKYEVTEHQYASLKKNDKSSPTTSKALPITNISWFDAIEFTNRFNQWLFKNNKDKLPKFDKSFGFLRLPTEAEWEFAARGGALVNADFFDRKTPYTEGRIEEYEWFGGPTSSHYKLQPVGLLKPNPLGLHDMLGNADEITISLFRVEYYQGRTGGFVIKGNNYTTAKDKLRSAFRTEQPFYRLDKTGVLEPQTKKTLGFRLVISSLVFPSRKVQQEMANQWDNYRDTLGANTPAVLSTGPTSVQTSAKSEDAFTYLERIKTSLKQKGVRDEEIENNLGLLDSSIQDMASIRLEAEEDASYLWVKIASEQARFIRRENQKLPTIDLLIEIAESQKNLQKVETYKERKKEHLINITTALSTYSDSIRQMSTKPLKIVEKGFKRYMSFLTEHNDGEQVQILNRVKKHYDEFQKTTRVDQDAWKTDIMSPK